MRLVVCGGLCALYCLSWWHRLYVECARAHSEAAEFAASEACQNATLNMRLGEYGATCRKANAIISIPPLSRSVYMLLDAVHICGRQRCEIVYMDVVNNLGYIVGGFVCLTALIFRFYGARREYYAYSLPQAYAEQKKLL